MKNPPLHIRLWFNVAAALTSLRLLGHPTRRGKPMLYSYQGAMPTMPLPSVRDTLKRSVIVSSIIAETENNLTERRRNYVEQE